MKKSILALAIAATAFMASCGSKTTQEVTSEEVESTIEEASEEEIPVLEEEIEEDSSDVSEN
ncbi:hypothetical protein [Cecembia lonarensis]|uniref:Lipoprotein n=1 Tax=Cecembia lonarensis (strain CCUG 58316 / KCTC 22772 / LW9) TaxID=1225176 RepID=K1LG20_CECL9|nr:hypothetical protein [Cecembia lonarensis]EKB49198.1 hypothetical protein B879_02209 [Cecembia lonarensis LW9]